MTPTVNVSPVLAAFIRTWNDSLDDATRQKLLLYQDKVIGTGNDGKDEQRAWMCVDWLARTQLPVWLDLAGLNGHAFSVRGMGVISDTVSASAAQSTLVAAWTAAGDETRIAAGDCVGDPARRAAWDAARWALGESATNAAWFATRRVALMGESARSASGTAHAAVESALRDVAWDAAWDAAGTSVKEKLAPWVASLQASAFELIDRMIAP